MLHTLLSRSLLVLFGVALFASLGCGPGKGTPVSGKVVLPRSMAFEKDDQVEVTFIPTDGKVKRGATISIPAPGKSSEVTFTGANTSETTGVLPGTYKIAVKVTPYMGAPGSQDRGRIFADSVNKKYDPDVSKLTIDIPASTETQNLTIDLGAGTVTK